MVRFDFDLLKHGVGRRHVKCPSPPRRSRPQIHKPSVKVCGINPPFDLRIVIFVDEQGECEAMQQAFDGTFPLFLIALNLQ